MRSRPPRPGPPRPGPPGSGAPRPGPAAGAAAAQGPAQLTREEGEYADARAQEQQTQDQHT